MSDVEYDYSLSAVELKFSLLAQLAFSIRIWSQFSLKILITVQLAMLQKLYNHVPALLEFIPRVVQKEAKYRSTLRTSNTTKLMSEY